MSKCVIGPNFATIGHRMIEISRFSNFNIAAVRHLGFLNSQNYNGRQSYEGEQLNMRHHTQNFVTVARYGDFSVFQDGGRRHVGFFQFQIFNGRTAEEGRTASLCQIWSKSVKTRPSYGDFSIFQDGGRRHLGFFKFQFFNAVSYTHLTLPTIYSV